MQAQAVTVWTETVGAQLVLVSDRANGEFGLHLFGAGQMLVDCEERKSQLRDDLDDCVDDLVYSPTDVTFTG